MFNIVDDCNIRHDVRLKTINEIKLQKIEQNNGDDSRYVLIIYCGCQFKEIREIHYNYESAKSSQDALLERIADEN